MIVLFGGTFDPVHFGHLRCACEVREALAPCDFRWLPAGQPPHRSGPVASPQHRCAMLAVALEGVDGVRIDDREVRRKGPSYMADTLREVREAAGEIPLVLVIGQDNAAGLMTWHAWRSLFDLAHLVIMRRPGSPLDCPPELESEFGSRRVRDVEALRSAPAGCVWYAPVTQLDISASRIRELLGSGRSARYLTPDAVLRYAGEHRVYCSGAPGESA